MTRVRDLERLRAVAVLMLLSADWPPVRALLPDALGHATTGVDLGLAIAGFVAARSALRELVPAGGPSRRGALGAAIRPWVTRRVLRIVPAAAAVVLASRVLAGALGGPFGTTRGWLAEAGFLAAGVYDYALPFHPGYRLAFLWPVAVALHVSLLVPALLLAVRGTGARLTACAVLAVASAAARSLPVPPGADASLFLLCATHLRLDAFLPGVALALVSDLPPGAPILPPPLVRWGIVPAAIATLAALPRAGPDSVVLHQGLLASGILSTFLVFYASLDRGYVLAAPGLGRALAWLGTRAYVLYLVHVPIWRLEQAERPFWPEYAARVPDAGAPVTRALVLFAASLVAAELLYRAIERPCRAWAEAPSAPERGVLARRAAAVAAGLAGLVAVTSGRHALVAALGPRDLALDAPVSSSSQDPTGAAPGALTDGLLGGTGLRTRVEDGPTATLDLGRVTDLGAIRVYNRAEEPERSLPLEVLVSDDGAAFRLAARRETAFTQEWPWRIRGVDLRGRYVRLRVDGRSALGLSEVEVYASPVMARIP